MTEIETRVLELHAQKVEHRTIAITLRLSRAKIRGIIRKNQIETGAAFRPKVLLPMNVRRRERVNALRDKRRAAGLCIYCANKAVTASSLCQRHADGQRKPRENRKGSGVCRQCQNPSLPGKVMCAVCGELNRANVRRITQERRAAGLCSYCGKKPVAPKRTQCVDCLERARTKARSTRETRLQAGLCTICGKAPLIPLTTACTTCFFKRTSHNTFGSVTDGDDLAAMFSACKGRCAYSGRVLVLGVNAELDHVIPICRGGSHTIENVQWVHHDVNVMKNSLSEQDFLSLVTDIFHFRIISGE